MKVAVFTPTYFYLQSDMLEVEYNPFLQKPRGEMTLRSLMQLQSRVRACDLRHLRNHITVDTGGEPLQAAVIPR